MHHEFNIKLAVVGCWSISNYGFDQVYCFDLLLYGFGRDSDICLCGRSERFNLFSSPQGRRPKVVLEMGCLSSLCLCFRVPDDCEDYSFVLLCYIDTPFEIEGVS